MLLLMMIVLQLILMLQLLLLVVMIPCRYAPQTLRPLRTHPMTQSAAAVAFSLHFHRRLASKESRCRRVAVVVSVKMWCTHDY